MTNEFQTLWQYCYKLMIKWTGELHKHQLIRAFILNPIGTYLSRVITAVYHEDIIEVSVLALRDEIVA